MKLNLLTASKVAQAMGMPVQRIYTLVREGVFPPGVVVRFGRQIRFNGVKLKEWIEQGGQTLPGGWKWEA